VLIADGFDFHIDKAYVYVSMAFSLAVELINLWLKSRAEAGTKADKP
jgi:predicted tellurium resistance membrane protein TerC